MISKPEWFGRPDIKPYVYMRRENLFANPGSLHALDWFTQDLYYRDPLKMADVGFADKILNLEGQAFHSSEMPTPRWVFYDCGVMPGLVCGFVQRRSSLPEELKEKLVLADKTGAVAKEEWVPISVFIIIPTVRKGEWVAHNLSSANSLISSKKDRYYALGFLSKAFGLWYANVEILCGMTQWRSPAIKLHSYFGAFEILTAYTPVHSYAQTLTYRSQIRPSYWPCFLDKKKSPESNLYLPTPLSVDPGSEKSLIELQSHIEAGEGPFYLKPSDIRDKPLDSEQRIYRLALE